MIKKNDLVLMTDFNDYYEDPSNKIVRVVEVSYGNPGGYIVDEDGEHIGRYFGGVWDAESITDKINELEVRIKRLKDSLKLLNNATNN